MSQDFGGQYGNFSGGSMGSGFPDPEIKSKVMAPAIALIVGAAVGILWGLWLLASGVLQAGAPEPVAPPNMPAEQARGFVQGVKLGRTFGPLIGIITIVASAVTVFGAVQMIQLRNYGMARIGAILSVIPCVGACCGCVGIPLGIWALVVLAKPEVKAAFH